MSLGFTITIVVLLALLTLASYVERLYAEMGRFLARDFQENIEVLENKVEPRMGVGRNRASISMSLLAQLSTAALAGMLVYSAMAEGRLDREELAKTGVAILFIVGIFNRLVPFILIVRTKGAWLTPLAPLLRILCYLLLVVTIPLGFIKSVASLAEEQAPEEPERPKEAVEALIEAGQEEGILEETDRELIQSVVEFGDTTVREVMTARPQITAVPATTTVEPFKALLRKKPFSRIPVYEGSVDKMQGIVFANEALQVPDADAKSKTVRDLLHPVKFVPESLQVSLLLREMQKDKIHMAVVVDEYGGVAGVVTIEDLVEEIVGEIRDENEPQSDIVRESDTSYVVPGSMDVYRLDELFHARPEGYEASTVAGLVSEALGRIPNTGEVLELDGLRFEVLQSTDRRIERLRISGRKLEPAEPLSA